MRDSYCRRIALLGAVTAFLIPFAAAALISQNLRLGDRGPDVQELQITLNRDSATRVAETGPGSPGNETEYFGPLTENAVRRLQQKYASEILAPIGLTSPTGFVGSQTRQFLAKLEENSTPPHISGSIPTVPAPPPPQTATSPVLASASPTIIIKVPQEITLTGTGFTQYGNTILTSIEPQNAFTNLPSADEKTIRFRYTSQIVDAFKNLANQSATASATPQDILQAISQNIYDPTLSTTTTKILLILQVKNTNGVSNTIRLLVDMPSVLLGEN